MPAIGAPGRHSRNVTSRPTPPITHRYIYFAGTLAYVPCENFLYGFKAAPRAARAAASASWPTLPPRLPLRPDQRRSAGAKDKTRAAHHVASFTSARGVVPAPAARLSGAGQNLSRPSVTAGQPHPSSCLVNVHAKTALSRTCPDQEMAAIGSRDTSGQGLDS